MQERIKTAACDEDEEYDEVEYRRRVNTGSSSDRTMYDKNYYYSSHRSIKKRIFESSYNSGDVTGKLRLRDAGTHEQSAAPISACNFI